VKDGKVDKNRRTKTEERMATAVYISRNLRLRFAAEPPSSQSFR